MLGPEVVLDCDYLDMGVVESGKFSAKSFKVVNNSDVPAAFQVINIISKFLSSKRLLMSNTFRLIQLSIFDNYLQKVNIRLVTAQMLSVKTGLFDLLIYFYFLLVQSQLLWALNGVSVVYDIWEIDNFDD